MPAQAYQGWLDDGVLPVGQDVRNAWLLDGKTWLALNDGESVLVLDGEDAGGGQTYLWIFVFGGLRSVFAQLTQRKRRRGLRRHRDITQKRFNPRDGCRVVARLS